MSARVSDHPSADILHAFGLGKLDDPAAQAIWKHLEACPACRQAVAAISGDDFVNRVRQAHRLDETIGPAKSLSGLARSLHGRPAAMTSVPAELAESAQYEMVRELGRGGMGIVYLAKNKLMDRLEVLKVVNQTLLDRPDTVERFLREIRAAAKLSHPNVVNAYSALQLGALLVFAMEYVDGKDLGALVKERGPLPVAHACFFVQQAALGLQHAFEHGMAHRDIKPRNLILTRQGKRPVVKVLDFGLAKVLREKKEDGGLTGTGAILGTPDYIAPEQTLDAAKADVQADIYSLGCTLYYLLVGRPPFVGHSLYEILHAHQTQEARPLNLERPEVPEELAAVVRKMMAKEPGKRYATPADVVRVLTPFIRSGTAPTAVLPPVSSTAGVAPGPGRLASANAKQPAKKQAAAPKDIATQPAAPAAVDWEAVVDATGPASAPTKSQTPRKLRAWIRWPLVACRWQYVVGATVAAVLVGVFALWMTGMRRAKNTDGPMVPAVEAPEVIDPQPYLTLGFLDKRMPVQLSRHGSVKPTGNQEAEKNETGYWYPSMRFGLRTVNGGGANKKLTFSPNGETNNTCLRIDGDAFLYGDKPFHTLSGRDVGRPNPGHWQNMELPLGKDATGRQRIGKKSVWVYDDPKISITQVVEIVPGLDISEDADGNAVRHLDTCLVRYQIANNDTDTHTVGLRFMLDTFIGSNDGVPFLTPVPGASQQLCDTEREFNTPESVPDYIQALEHDNLEHPGTIARLQLKLGGGIEPPTRVTLGAWPNPELGRRHPDLADRCLQEKTMWEVPVLSIKSLPDNPDSAVTMYWGEKPLFSGQVRQMGVAYGLGYISTSAGGQLGLSARGSVEPAGEFTLTALVRDPKPGQTVTLMLPDGAGFERLEGRATQQVPALRSRLVTHVSAVTWRVQAPPHEGTFTLSVTGSDGQSQAQKIRVKKQRVFLKGET